MMHHRDRPKPRYSFYDVWRCPLCKQWWRLAYSYGDYDGFSQWWESSTRIRLILRGLNSQCRSFLRHNKKGAA